MKCQMNEERHLKQGNPSVVLLASQSTGVPSRFWSLFGQIFPRPQNFPCLLPPQFWKFLYLLGTLPCCPSLSQSQNAQGNLRAWKWCFPSPNSQWEFCGDRGFSGFISLQDILLNGHGKGSRCLEVSLQILVWFQSQNSNAMLHFHHLLVASYSGLMINMSTVSSRLWHRTWNAVKVLTTAERVGNWFLFWMSHDLFAQVSFSLVVELVQRKRRVTSVPSAIECRFSVCLSASCPSEVVVVLLQSPIVTWIKLLI